MGLMHPRGPDGHLIRAPDYVPEVWPEMMAPPRPRTWRSRIGGALLALLIAVFVIAELLGVLLFLTG